MAVNWDAVNEAREKLEKNISFEKYYNEVIDSKEQLGARSLVPCPLHDETTASFKYFSDTNSFYCFGCEKTGNIVDLHYYLVQRNIENYSRINAILDLAKDYSISIPNIFDESYVNKEVLFKHKATKIRDDKQYPLKWIVQEIEKSLEVYKKTDIDYYIQTCNIVDKIYMVGYDTEHKLLEILNRIDNKG